MAEFRADEALVGLIALATIPWIVWILRRGLRDRQLPVGKAPVGRAERPAAFRIHVELYVVAALAMAYIGLDLLVGIGG